MTTASVISLPTPERLRRKDIEIVEHQIQDADGNIGHPFRAVDTLRLMEIRGSITKEMRNAGEKFRDHFSSAQFVPLRAADMGRIPGAFSRPLLTGRIMEAKDKVWTALKMLGGQRSPAGAIAWYVLGEQMNLEEWASKGGWSGRPLKPHTAAGILIGTLGALEAHYEGGK